MRNSCFFHKFFLVCNTTQPIFRSIFTLVTCNHIVFFNKVFILFKPLLFLCKATVWKVLRSFVEDARDESVGITAKATDVERVRSQ